MNLLKSKKQNKSVWVLAIISAAASVLFSFMGAPFMRALFVSTRSSVFWSTAILLVGSMFAAGAMSYQFNYKISETAVYVGSIWMTLGAYSELEKRGVNYRGAGLISLGAGLLFALAGYFLILKNLITTDILSETLEPLRIAINQAFPDSALQPGALVKYLPGVFTASLFGSLALSFAFESKVIRMFKIRHEKVASGLRWLEFRLSDGIIWLSLISLLVLGLNLNNQVIKVAILKTVSVNFLIIAVVAFLFQGLAVIEFMIRFYRFGLFTRTMTYLLIILQLAPLVVLVGFVDYWADFRKRVRKKIKATTS